MKRRPEKSHIAKPTREALVEIEKPIYGGAFLARVEGKATFVPLTLPGEQARIRIIEEKKSFATAEAEELVLTAPERVAPGCRHFGACGGCQYQHADYEAQLLYKQAILRETLERGGIRAPEKIEVLAGRPWQYRNRIRLAFDGSGRAGYRARRLHDLIPISECPIAAPVLVKAALVAGEILSEAKTGLRPFEIALFSNAEESAVLASLFVRGSSNRGFEQFYNSWKERIPALAGAELVEEGRAGQATNVIEQIGVTSLVYAAGGMDYRIDQGAFFQVNRWLIDALVDRVVAGRSGELAWDLYAGVGLFAKSLAKSFGRVVAVESASTASEALRYNLSGGAADCVIAETTKFLRAQGSSSQQPDLVVVDPPRTGLGEETTSLLAGVKAPSIVYVSCDPATLARDMRTLINSGYQMSSLTLADMFPQTFHLESVVELCRS